MVWVACVASRIAFADPPTGDDTRAVALFEEGRQLDQAGKYAEACDRFEQSYKLEYSVGTALNLGDCLEKLGHVRRAYQMFIDTEVMERSHGGRRASYAHDRAAALAEKLGTITVKIVDPDMPGLALTIDGHAVRPAAVFRELYEPGKVAVVVSAPGHVEFRASVEATANQATEISVPALAVQPLPAPVPVAATQPAMAEPTELHPRHSRTVLAWGLGGAGAAALVTGIGLGLYGRSQYLDQFSSGHCAGSQPSCDPIGVTNVDHANRIADVGTIVGAVGVALGVAGVVTYLTAPRDRITVSATRSGVGVAIEGGF